MLAWLERLVADEKARRRIFVLFWIVSTGVLLLGFAIIAWRAFVPR